jgi:hypothetical protein
VRILAKVMSNLRDTARAVDCRDMRGIKKRIWDLLQLAYLQFRSIELVASMHRMSYGGSS